MQFKVEGREECESNAIYLTLTPKTWDQDAARIEFYHFGVVEDIE